ncbi:synaptogenesis protein syg-2-like [Lycorma delicatula]|uniref:synaptogenesis protein syg-2-like n=1 Tax=Lycorma delicatula TaxID=130591 RepID=UPI003F516B71
MLRRVQWLVWFVLFYQRIGIAECLRGLKISVPEAVIRGNPVFLSCDYDLENGEALYSIKWYREDHEFYRYVPKESPPTRVFSLPGVLVDISRSNEKGVMLMNATRPLTGEYRCEVSADAPLFHTDWRSAFLTVVDIPASEPEVRSEKRNYESGEQIRANCTSPPSYPAANLTWYLNEQLAEQAAVYQVEPGGSNLKNNGGDLQSAVSHLQLEAGSGKLRIHCEASLYDVYIGRSRILELRQDSPRPASVLGPGHNGAPALEYSLKLTSIILLLTSRR